MSAPTEPHDSLFAGAAPPTDFVFDQQVARVFPDMLRRSVPGWPELLRLLGLVAARVSVPGRPIYDLGCSLGATSASLLARLPQARIVAVDNAPAMLDGLRARLAEPVAAGRVRPVCADIVDVPVSDAGLIVLNLTLQFVPPAARQDLLRRLRAGLVPGGALLLVEKVIFPDAATDALMDGLHQDFKRGQGYSALEIARKRAALEAVLVPEDIETHEERLRAAGFTRIERWFQCLNFVGWLARG
ncbi:carboxy-S-adenosyl-L-methionine synthase CmoA [Thiohalocapsa halophila]|uniref:Carboxy-S-adenosyl-L-methionine synthase n=1 Tax=Thiohalocapsa halophila TaxID=69359 RepID=A0ABS1CHI4_9GAMM|nr:carboxy-S-adenosyl-L-methionine synthase CmoA [Thiohalocapsa halophila]MBK1631381.1 carboxy-S-adenosyl-L-methionine synthase CmoA [Thiohalocapsa halophila]